MGLHGAPGVFRSQPHHIHAGPGLRNSLLAVSFDPKILDLVAPVPDGQSMAIAQFELPLVCDMRPHEDSYVEAWLQRWLDEGPGDDEAMILEASCLPQLQALLAERPEVCPMLRHLLGRFEAAIAQWLLDWPACEPPCQGFSGAQSAGSPEELELELHAVLALVGGCVGRQAQQAMLPASYEDAMGHFRQVACGWIFKLESLYGLEIISQPERVSPALQGNGERLSVLWWDLSEVSELLRCAFFRPSEISLWRFAKRWCLEGAGAVAMASQEVEFATAGEAPAKEEIDAVISEALVWDLLPPKEELASSPETAAGSSPSLQAAKPETSTEGEPVTAEAAGAQSMSEAALRFNASAVVPGCTFSTVQRRSDCELAQFDEPDAIHIQYGRHPSTTLHCWNNAKEQQVLGAARKLLASSVPMSSAGGKFRLDLRVNRGTAAEAAHLFEVGLMANPSAGVCFKAEASAPCRPFKQGEQPGKGEPFFRFATVLDVLLEGVRLSIEVDLAEASVQLRNVPEVNVTAETLPRGASLPAWLLARKKALVMADRNPGELDCPLFKEHVEHLSDLLEQGTLEGDLAKTFLADAGAKWVMDMEIAPDTPEEYHFYIVVPAGLELEIF
eukprot:TRINITY_DN27023_c0_g1_i2.p1 TRINITY_DN27023_c0_g1~~TRINITY_DN27023_c0_g1_i2.p1  ORF type:complete len:616 (+),score=127.29 TRINITY_DN27023_c0_g1_i2:31-1878(+)